MRAFNLKLKSIYLLIFLLLCSLISSAFFNVSNAAAEVAAVSEVQSEKTEVVLSDDELKSGKELFRQFLDSVLLGDKSYEKYIVNEINDSYIQNNYIIDNYIIKNYKTEIELQKNGEGVCTYNGPDEIIKQEFSLTKTHDNQLKIDTISEKRYIKMNPKRRQCYINTRAIYKAASILESLTAEMEVPAAINYDILKANGLIKEELKCPGGGVITFNKIKSGDSNDFDLIAHCDMHGDFFELYKIEEKVLANPDKYNKDLDNDEAPVLEKISGDTYKKFQKIQPFETAFYNAMEKKDVQAMRDNLNKASQIDVHLGNMYLVFIRMLRELKDEKTAKEIFDIAIKVYPNWKDLKNSLSEKLQQHIDEEDGIN
ncbi:MAG: hypothetical protein QMC67_02525 [Candidatus Wallbacteria bacterium]